jgi:hypothetical protein
MLASLQLSLCFINAFGSEILQLQGGWFVSNGLNKFQNGLVV